MSEDNKNAPQKPQKEQATDKSGNVFDLQKIMKVQAPPKDKLYTRAMIEDDLCEWFGFGIPPEKMSEDEAAFLDSFPCYGYRLQPTDAIRYLRLDTKTGLAEFVGKDELDRELRFLFSRFKDKYRPSNVYLLSTKQREQLAPTLMASRLFHGEIKPTGYLKTEDDDTFCFHRYSFTPIRNAAYFPGNFDTIAATAPIFTSFLRRMENAEPLCQVIGASLAGKPIRKQAPLIFGEPGCGKSMFLEILKVLFGPGWVDFNANWKSNYATADLENKTGWGFDEADPKFINSDEFKRITGSQTVGMQRPYVGLYQGSLLGNFYMTCNTDRLHVFNNSAITKERLLTCKIRGVIPEGDRESPEKMLDRITGELAAIHGYCLDVFEALGNQIEKDMTSIMGVVEETEEEMCDIFETFFVLDPTAQDQITSRDFLEVWNHDVKLNFPSFFHRLNSQKAFRRYVRGLLGRDRLSVVIRKGANTYRYISGLRKRGSMER